MKISYQKMKKALPLLSVIVSVSFCFSSCEEKSEKVKQLEEEVVTIKKEVLAEPEKSDLSKDTVVNNESTFSSKTWEIKEDEYAFTVETLEYIEYKSENKPEKIIDFETVKKSLKGVVVFTELGDVSKGVSEIRFKNGKTITNLPDDISFVAYYLNEDVILFENPAGLDVSYNLSTAEETELTGNPEHWVVSEDKQYRLNGYLNSNDCITYFIQIKVNGVYKNIIPLSDVFEKNEEFRLCQIKHAFWANGNRTLYIEESFFDLPSNIYRITLHNAGADEIPERFYTTELRPNQKIEHKKPYTDTVKYLGFNDDYDYWYMNLQKNKDTISVIYNANEKEVRELVSGENLTITWQMDRVVHAGDTEILDFREYLISFEKLVND